MVAKELRSIVENFSTAKILVVGDVMLDEYVYGAVNRTSPEAPVSIVSVRNRIWSPGGAANVAVGITRLGGMASLIGVVGNRATNAADILREQLITRNVATSGLITDRSRLTTTKTRVVDGRNKQLLRIDDETPHRLAQVTEEQLLECVSIRIAGVNACVISDYDKGVVTPAVAVHVIDAARTAGIPVIVDPRGDSCDRYRGATVVKPNLVEAERMVGFVIKTFNDLLVAGHYLLPRLNCEALLITQGADGMNLFRKDCETWHLGSAATKVLDITGAGDAVTCALALALAVGAGIEQAVEIANLAAAICVSNTGTRSANSQELLAAIELHKTRIKDDADTSGS